MNIKKLFFLLLFIFCFKQVMALDCSVPEPECLWNKSKIAFKRNVQNLGNKYLNILIEKYPESDYGIKAKIFIEEKNLKNKKLDDIEIDRIKRFIELHKATIGIPEFSKKVGNYLIKKSDDQFNQNNFDEAILILIQSKNFLVDHKIVNNKILIIENAFNTYLEKEALTNAKYNKFEESYKIIDLLKKRMVSKNQINSLKFKVDQIIYNTLYDKGLHYRKKGLQEESLELFIKSEHFKKTESVKNIINNIIINKIISFVNFGRESLKKYRIKIAKNNFDKASVLGLPLVVKNQLDEEIIEFTILKSLNDNKLDLAAEYLLSAEENQILKYDLDNLWVVYNKLKKKEDVVIYKNVIIYNKYEIINILKQKNISYRPYVVTRPYNNLLNPEIKKIPITLPKPLLKKRLFKFKDMPQQAMIPLPEVPLLEPDSLSPNLPKPMISISLPEPEAKLPNLEQKNTDDPNTQT